MTFPEFDKRVIKRYSSWSYSRRYLNFIIIISCNYMSIWKANHFSYNKIWPLISEDSLIEAMYLYHTYCDICLYWYLREHAAECLAVEMSQPVLITTYRSVTTEYRTAISSMRGEHLYHLHVGVPSVTIYIQNSEGISKGTSSWLYIRRLLQPLLK